jgi:short-subunit dehydrogenase
MPFKDKVAIVTGASSGIGLATARLLASRGAKVALVARSIGKLRKISRELLGSWPIRADMTKEDDIKRMIAETRRHFGRIDILINGAGQGYDAPVEKIDIATFRKMFNLNVVGPLIAMQNVIPIMREQKQGAIVNLSSGTALMFLPNMSPYSSLKRALAGMTLTAREELKKDNIRVSVVYPYMTLTDFEKNTIKDTGEVQAEAEGEPEEGGRTLPLADKPEYLAQRILAGIESNEAEILAHDWMKKTGQ